MATKRNGRGRHPRPDERRMTADEKAAINREVGKKGGRPLGSRDLFPRGMIPALRQMHHRLKEEHKNDPLAQEAAAAGLEGYIRVLNGQVHSRRAPSVLKAAFALRSEFCEPIVQTSKVEHSLSLASAVEQANKRIAEKQLLRDPMLQAPRDRSRDETLTQMALAAPVTRIPPTARASAATVEVSPSTTEEV